MIENSGKYYLYRHIRLDTNQPFYIGIGKKAKKGVKYQYKRALDFVLRSELWKRIYNKSNKNIKVDILLESDNHEFIKEKEKEFIKLYGRINKSSGILCNFTDGGDTRAEVEITLESRLKRSEAAKKRRPSDKFFENSRKTHIINVYQYDLEGNFIREFESLTEAAKSCNSMTTNISRCCKSNLHSAAKFIWRYYKTNKIEPARVTWKAKIYKYSLEKELLTIYDNAEEAGHFENFYYTTIQDYCRKNFSPLNSKIFFSYLSPDRIQSVQIKYQTKRIYSKKEKIKIFKERILSKEFLAHIGVKQKVKVTDLSENFYKIYPSIEECAKELKISKCSVSLAINKNKTIKKLNLKLEKYES